jgi:hypothetical protein
MRNALFLIFAMCSFLHFALWNVMGLQKLTMLMTPLTSINAAAKLSAVAGSPKGYVVVGPSLRFREGGSGDLGSGSLALKKQAVSHRIAELHQGFFGVVLNR